MFMRRKEEMASSKLVVSGNPDVAPQDTSMSLEDLLNDAVLGSHGGRGKRKTHHLEEQFLDKATLQKQRRMIKNRESAARSRERKQAYTVELETLVTHLEEENAQLLMEEVDRRRQRYNQLMECLIPVEEKRKPREMLRRVNSAQW
ncbi:G-box-binding factor 4 [Cajanus cajan]|nr:G-box-binding factor 4 [Cajanus cajan]